MCLFRFLIFSLATLLFSCSHGVKVADRCRRDKTIPFLVVVEQLKSSRCQHSRFICLQCENRHPILADLAPAQVAQLASQRYYCSCLRLRLNVFCVFSFSFSPRASFSVIVSHGIVRSNSARSVLCLISKRTLGLNPITTVPTLPPLLFFLSNAISCIDH